MHIFAFQNRVASGDVTAETLYGCETHRKARHRTGQTISETYPKHSANGYLRKKLQQFCSERFCLPLTVVMWPSGQPAKAGIMYEYIYRTGTFGDLFICFLFICKFFRTSTRRTRGARPALAQGSVANERSTCYSPPV